MSDGPAEIVRRLFSMPGEAEPMPCQLARHAAVAHHEMLQQAVREHPDPMVGHFLQRLDAQPAERRCQLLHDPALVQSLHALAKDHPELQRWHRRVGSPSMFDIFEQLVGRQHHAVGNVLLSLETNLDRGWTGQLHTSTDPFGRVRFPLSDWSLAIDSAADKREDSVSAGTPLDVSVDSTEVRWRIAGQREACFTMSRADLLAMVLDNVASLSPAGTMSFDRRIHARWRRAVPLTLDGPTFDPIVMKNRGKEHFGKCGAIVQAVLHALRAASPAVYDEFSYFIHSVRALELHSAAGQRVESFSDPTWPGIMHIQVAFSADDEPCLSPFCFLWFGHELGHTKNYLIDSVAYRHDWHFVENRHAMTDRIGRYGRRLSVRTIFQVPYVHLYEWVLLMDMMDRQFRDLPWDVDADPIAAGEEIRGEIDESFALIHRHAHLTPLGQAALERFKMLFGQMEKRWIGLTSPSSSSTASSPPPPDRRSDP